MAANEFSATKALLYQVREPHGHAVYIDFFLRNAALIPQDWTLIREWKINCEMSPTSWRLRLALEKEPKSLKVTGLAILRRTDSVDEYFKVIFEINTYHAKFGFHSPAQRIDSTMKGAGDVRISNVDNIVPNSHTDLLHQKISVHIHFSIMDCQHRSKMSPLRCFVKPPKDKPPVDFDKSGHSSRSPRLAANDSLTEALPYQIFAPYGHAVYVDFYLRNATLIQEDWTLIREWTTDCKASPTSWLLILTLDKEPNSLVVSGTAILRRTDFLEMPFHIFFEINIYHARFGFHSPTQRVDCIMKDSGDVMIANVDNIVPSAHLELLHQKISVQIRFSILNCHGPKKTHLRHSLKPPKDKPPVDFNKSDPSVEPRSDKPAVDFCKSCLSQEPSSDKPPEDFDESEASEEPPSDKPTVDFDKSGSSVEPPTDKPRVDFVKSNISVEPSSNKPAVDFGKSGLSVETPSHKPKVDFDESGPSVEHPSDKPPVDFDKSDPSVETPSDKPRVDFDESSPSVEPPSEDFDESDPSVAQPSYKPTADFGKSGLSVEPPSDKPRVDFDESSPSVEHPSDKSSEDFDESGLSVEPNSDKTLVYFDKSCPSVEPPSDKTPVDLAKAAVL